MGRRRGEAQVTPPCPRARQQRPGPALGEAGPRRAGGTAARPEAPPPLADAARRSAGLPRSPPAGTMAAAPLARSPAQRSREPPPRYPNGGERGKEEKSPSPSEGETLNVALCRPPSEEPRSQEDRSDQP